MKTILATFCFAIVALTFGVVSAAQDTIKHDSTQADTSQKTSDVTGNISNDGKMFVSDSDNKSWIIINPDFVKGHEGHHVILTARVDLEKNEVNVVSLKMAK